MASWTAEEDATIRSRARTHSATQIAALLPGRSRAAVTGRAWRLGESLAKDCTTRRGLEHPNRRIKRRAAPPLLAPAPADSWPSAPPTARRAALAVQPLLLVLEALEPGQCRWPYGEGELRFCGHPRAKGPYCRAHHDLAFVPDQLGYDPDALADAIEQRERRVRTAA